MISAQGTKPFRISKGSFKVNKKAVVSPEAKIRGLGYSELLSVNYIAMQYVHLMDLSYAYMHVFLYIKTFQKNI